MYLATRCLWQYRDAARQRPAAYVLILNHDVSIAVGLNAVGFLDYRAKPRRLTRRAMSIQLSGTSKTQLRLACAQ